MRRRQTVLGLLASVAGAAVLTLAFYGSDVLLRRLPWRLPDAAVAVISPWLALLVAGLAVGAVTRRINFHARFDPIRKALGRIARGDFDVRLPAEQEQPLADLVAGVNRMAADLGRLETMRQEFVANVSHEIQSPLTSIRGFARALRDEGLTSEQRSAYLEIIETESVRLSRLSDNLLMLAALETAEGGLAKAPFRLDRQIREVILAFEPQWRAKAIDWDLRLAKATVTAHEELLGQVWLNLLQNAVKFSHPGGRIEVDLRTQDGAVTVQVVDHGIGITPADQLRIFERFYKADKARDRSMGGNGLGLAIIRKIVLLHGGAITVESEPGAGATFTVTLPV